MTFMSVFLRWALFFSCWFLKNDLRDEHTSAVSWTATAKQCTSMRDTNFVLQSENDRCEHSSVRERKSMLLNVIRSFFIGHSILFLQTNQLCYALFTSFNSPHDENRSTSMASNGSISASQVMNIASSNIYFSISLTIISGFSVSY